MDRKHLDVDEIIKQAKALPSPPLVLGRLLALMGNEGRSRAEIVRIVDLMIDKVDERLRDKDMGIELTSAAKELLGKRGFDPVLGARPLRRTIQREIEDALSERILFGDLNDPQSKISQALLNTNSTQIRADLELNTGVRYTNV